MDTAEKVAEAHERLVGAVEALVSADDWQAALKVAARFHSYSFGNVLLILSQMPEATRVAGYRTWQSLGRQVDKGEKGIAILAPCKYKATTKDQIPPNESPEVLPDAAESSAMVVRGWRVVHVFDESQTSGSELATMERPELLAGEAPEGLWDRLAEMVADAGYSLERGSCGEANGWTDYDTRTIRVRTDVDYSQASKTLAHELAHSLMHRGRSRTERTLIEVEAESVAFVVCSAAGMATDGYSFAYVAGWSGGDAEVVRAAGARIMATAQHIADRVGAGRVLVGAT